MITKAESCLGSPVRGSLIIGRSARSFRLKSAEATSIRNPSAPRSNQNLRIFSNSSGTFGFHQFRSGCSGAKRWRYHWPLLSSFVQAGPLNADSQLFGGEPYGFESAK